MTYHRNCITWCFAHENLAEGESILHEGRFHPVNWHLRWVVYIALPTFAIAFPFLFWVSDPHVSGLFAFSIFCFLLLPLPWVLYLNRCYAYNKVYKTEFVLTNKRLITKKGFMRTVVREIQLQKVESVDYGQTFLESWFNVGRLTVRGTGGGKVGKFTFLLDTLEFRKRILDQIDKVSE